MKIKLFIAAAFLLISSGTVASQSFPTCSSDVCTQVVHNKEVEKLSVLVWDSEGQIIHSSEVKLDKNAVLEHTSNEASPSNRNSTDVYSTANDSNAPPAPCTSGSCSTTSSSTYRTATEVVTVTIIYTYDNGQLVGVDLDESRNPRHDDERDMK